jgi:hypothetical protein
MEGSTAMHGSDQIGASPDPDSDSDNDNDNDLVPT